MNSKLTLVAGAALLLLTALPAQNIKDNDISFVYIQLPKEPLGKSYLTYQSNVVLAYASDNAAKRADYDAKMKIVNDNYDKDMKEWTIRDAEMEAKYQKEMEEYNKKSVVEKVADEKLLNEGKPVRQRPPHPYRQNPPEPILKKEYDTNLLASSYLRLEGFSNEPANAVVITATLYGFDCMQPHLVSEQRKMTSYANGKSTDYMATYYHYETSYKFPMAVKVEVPGKGIVFNQTIDQFNQYITVKTAETQNPNDQHMYPESYVQTLEEKAVVSNLQFINDLVNNKYGFARITRKTVLNNVESKKLNYDDFQSAYDNALAGYNMLASDRNGALAKLQLAIDTWEKALLESNPADKKARVDAGVTMAAHFNLVEAYIMIGDFTNAEAHLAKINSSDPGKKEKHRAEELDALLKDSKARAEANR